ncbi:MAG: RluA family pseudouridine synthase [Desulfuromonas sp.]|uniref:RluA family pseudouridine synthase n=1 Tax=Desulfuromonas sp. TaxID=892 RepID=UPI000CC34910|nr:RluA family pseudouridine synthase [Desulfuromonas sp.]PLX83886.1 MAG: RluA family pseudouridine synthase [Desulfuromonas sp.]
MEDVRQLLFEAGRLPERLDRFLTECLPELTRSQIKKLIDNGHVRLDGAAVKASSRLKGGETLEVVIPDAAPAKALPEAIPLHILYEDRHLVVVDKPAGLVVHPAPGHGGGTLVNALLYHCTDLSGVGGELRPGIVHRLDKDTSGAMLATKNDLAHNHLAGQFKAHTITRRYIALVHGIVQKETGTVDRPIGRHPVHRKKMSGRSRAGRRAITHWRVLRRYDQDKLSLMEMTLETGRTHQIRVHLSEEGMPIVGDPVYGNPGRASSVADPKLRALLLGLGRQALHARLLGFVHPASGDYMEFESPPPPDLGAILNYLDAKYKE